MRGLATGIGSLPHKDVQAAVDLVLKYFPVIPFWPQLPKRSIREGMVAQFSENLPGIKIAADGLLFDPRAAEKELETFYEHIIASDLEYFKISQDSAAGLYAFYERLKKTDLSKVEFIKCQITGPFTLAASINAADGKALLHDEIFMQAILKHLAMKAGWQIKFFQEFNKKIILFLDEPYLGCFGSAFTPLNREQAVKGLRELTEALKAKDCLIGVHCCGNTDWSIFTEIKSLDIINFDAFGFLDKLVLYAEDLKGFLKRGGILCWGIVPTQEFSDKINRDLLFAKLKDGINALVKKGADKDLLANQLMLSPACGLGTLDTDKSEKIFSLLAELAQYVRK